MPEVAHETEPTRHCARLLDRGEEQRAAHAPAHRTTLLEAGRLAQEIGDPALLARAATAVSRSFLIATGGPDPERIALVEAAVAAHRADSPTRARLLASLAGERALAGERTTAAVLIEEAVAVARRTGSTAALLMALATHSDVVFHPATLDQRHGLAIELEERATTAGDDVYRWRAASMATVCALERGDADGAERHLTQAVERAEALGDPVAHFVTTLQRATWAIARGHLAEAEEITAAAHRLGIDARSDLVDSATIALTVQIRTFQGRLDETMRQMGPRRLEMPAGRAAYALMCAESGHPVEAANAFASVVSHSREPIPRDVTWAFGTAALAEACSHLGAARRASELEATLAPYRHQHLAHLTYYLGPAAHPLGLLRAAQGDAEGAQRLLSEAEAGLVAFGAPAHLARTRLARCRVLTASPRRGAGRQASALARGAAAEARAAGFEALADQLEAHV